MLPKIPSNPCDPGYSDPPLSARILETPAQLLQYRSLWTSWGGTRDSDLDFFLYISGMFPNVLRPHVVVAYHGDTPEGMLIGRLEQRPVPIEFGYLRLATPPLRVLDFVSGALRGAASPESTTVLVHSVLKSLRDDNIDLAIFENLPLDSHLYRAIRSVAGLLDSGVPPEHRTHRCLRLPPSSDALYSLISTRHRQNYRRKARKLLKDFSGDVRIERYTQTSDALFRQIESVAQTTYHRQFGLGFRDTPDMRRRCELEASKGWLRISMLYVAGKPCAYLIASAYNRTLYGDHMGYDPAYAAYSPGMYLLLNTLGDLCDHKWNDDITRIDFGFGDAEYKSALSNCSYEDCVGQIYGHTLRGICVNLCSTPLLLANRSLRWLLIQTNLLQKAKHLWRDRVTRQERPVACGGG